MMAKKICVVSELYYPEESATGHYMTQIAESLAQQYTVMAVCAQPTYLARGTRAPKQETHNGVEITRIASTTFNKNRILLRLINVASIAFSMFRATVRLVRKGDYIIVVTNPPLLPYIALVAGKLRGARCIVRVDDVYPDVMAATGMLENTSWLYRFLDWFVPYLFNRCERIVVLGRDMSQLITRKLNGRGDKIHIIPNWADVADVKPIPRNSSQLLKELGLDAKFVVQCAGNMGRAQSIETFLEAAIKLREHLDIHFLFIGGGTKKEWLQEQIAEHKLNNITILPNRPRSDQTNFLNACDIAVSTLVPGMLGISVPSRMYNILAAGKPIIAVVDSRSEVALVVEDEQVGWVVPPGDADKLAMVISEASNNRDMLADMGKRARLVAETKYSFPKVITQYHDLIEGMESQRT